MVAHLINFNDLQIRCMLQYNASSSFSFRGIYENIFNTF